MKIFAPAKINLTLHVTGQRADGYHLLDSLVVFADVGDEIWLQIGNMVSLTVEGPEREGVPADLNNLVLKVAQLFDGMPGASFLLTKNLPTASGIGGGSADAAAAFRGLMCHWSDLMPGDSIPPDMFDADQTPMGKRLLGLGADIPACLLSQPVRMAGIGEVLTPLPELPTLYAVLVNPRCAVPTPQIFKGLKEKENAPMEAALPRFTGPGDFALWLGEQRNDLQPVAETLEPEITQVLRELTLFPDCLLARMSGSGATCFGLFESRQAAENAAKRLRADRPEWWIRPTRLGRMTDAAMPRIT